MFRKTNEKNFERSRKTYQNTILTSHICHCMLARVIYLFYLYLYVSGNSSQKKRKQDQVSQSKMKEQVHHFSHAFTKKRSKGPHEGVTCDSCSMSPIVGARFECTVCPDYDLCAECEAREKQTNNTDHLCTSSSDHRTAGMTVEELSSMIQPILKGAMAKVKSEVQSQMNTLAAEQRNQVVQPVASSPICSTEVMVRQVANLSRLFVKEGFVDARKEQKSDFEVVAQWMPILKSPSQTSVLYNSTCCS